MNKRTPGFGISRIVGAERSKNLCLHKVLAISVVLLCVSIPRLALADTKQQPPAQLYEINIPALDAAEALNQLAIQTGATFLFPYELAKSRRANPLVGRYTLMDALDRLLKGSGLSGGLSDTDTIKISLTGEIEANDEEEAVQTTFNKNTHKNNLLTAIISFLFASGGAQGVEAQESVSTKKDGAAFSLEEIIVTAQKREQSVQDIPIAITAITANAIETQGITNPQDLQFLAPGLSFSTGWMGRMAVASIRGIGTDTLTAGSDPAVGFHIDGHYMMYAGYLLSDFYDVERIEVLRGPQGTLYGRNVIGGAINIITKRPTEEFEGSVSVQAANYSARKIQALISGPITDNLRGRLTVVDNYRDGFVENINGGPRLNDTDYTAIRGSLVYNLTDDIEIFISAYKFDDNSVTTTLRSEYPQEPLIQGLVPNWFPEDDEANGNPRKVNYNDYSDMPNFNESEGIFFDVEWNFGDYTFRSLSSYNDSGHLSFRDRDDSPREVTRIMAGLDTTTVSQEFQLLRSSAKSNWVGGLYYFTEDTSGLYRDWIDDLWNYFLKDADGNPVPGSDDLLYSVDNAVDTKSFGAFSQLDLSLSDAWELSVGLRYTIDKKSAFGLTISPPFGFPGTPLVDDDEWSKVTGKVGVNYHLNDDAMLYTSLSRGYKSGGYDATAADTFKPEIVDAFEFGLKANFWQHRAQVNVDTFYNDYTDKQVTTYNPATFLAQTNNAGAATTYGVEIETLVRPSDALTLDAMLAYLHARYDVYENAYEAHRPELLLQDVSGNIMVRSPEWKFKLGTQYEWDLGSLGASLLARVDYTWTDRQYFTVFNRKETSQGAYNRINTRLILESYRNGWSAEMFVNNLTDDDILSYAGVELLQYGGQVDRQYHPPRTYGIKINYDF